MRKKCRECGRSLTLDTFKRQYRSSDGYTHICKDCLARKRPPRLPCIVEGCDRLRYGHGLCSRHYAQLTRKGAVLERTYRDWNRIEEYAEHAEIILEDKDCREVARCITDLKDVEAVRKYCWHWTGDRVQTTPTSQQKISLPRYLLGIEDQDMLVLHKDHDPLNNRRGNLVIGDARMRAANLPLRCDNKSGCKGVYLHRASGRWSAELKVRGRKHWGGLHGTLEEAIAARKRLEEKYLSDVLFSE